jgi:fused signal recognition particle receptor
MRSAIRGDFERLARRRGGQELMREPEEARAEPDPAPEPEEVATSELEPVVEPEPVEPEPVEPAPVEPEPVEPEPVEPGPWPAVEAVPVGEAAVPDAEAPPDELPEAEDAPAAVRVEPEEPRRSLLDRLLGR